MPEEDLTYNISLNEEELGAQLERIRSQIDLTMGSIASGGGAGIPQASDLIDFGAFGSPSAGGGVTNVSAQMEQGMWSNMAAGFDQAAETSTLGFNKFTNDMRRIGLLSSPQYPDHGPQNIGSFPQHPPTGLGQSMGSMVAPSLFGFNPNRGGMNYYDYKSQAADNVVDSFEDFASGNAGAILGTTVGGALGGWGGAFGGLGVGSTVDLFAEVFGRRTKERLQMEGGLKAIAEDAFNGIGTGEARSMAADIQNKVYSLSGQQQGYDMDAVQENVLNFANAGGFDIDTNGQEMQETLRGVVENTREFANNLKMAQDDAVRIMAELKNNMVMNTTEMGSFSATMQGLSDQYGMDPAQTVGFGMQGMEMLRGTGATAGQGFNMAIEARLQAQRLSLADPTTRQLINQAGGVDQFAYGQMETASRWMQSGQGMMAMTGLLGGMNGMPGSLTGMLQGSANFLTQDPNNFFEFQTRQGELNASLGFENQQAMMVGTGYRLAEQLGRTNADGTINEDALAGIMKFGMNMDPQQAKSAIRGFQDFASTDSQTRQSMDLINQIRSASEESKTGPWSQFKGTIGYGVSQLYSESIGKGYAVFSDWVDSSLESAGDALVGRERWEGTNLSNKRLQNAKDVTDSELYQDMMSKDITQEEIDQTVEEGVSPYRDRLTRNSKLRAYYEPLRKEYGDEFVDQVIAGHKREKGGLINALSTFNESDLSKEQFEQYRKIYNVSSIGDLSEGQQETLNNMDLSQIGGSAENPMGIMNSVISQITNGEVTAFSEASEGQRRLAKTYVESQNLLDTDREDVQMWSRSWERIRSNTRENRFDIRSDQLLEKYANTAGSITEDVSSSIGDSISAEGETLRGVVEHIIENPAAGPGDLEGFNISNSEYQRIKGKVKGSNDFASAREFYTTGIGIQDRGKLLAAGDEILGELGGDILNLRGSPEMRSAMADMLADYDQRGQDFTFGVHGSESAFRENLRSKGLDQEAIDRKVQNQAFSFQASEIAENITRERAQWAAESGNAEMFIKNQTKAMEVQMVSSLNNIIDEDGIRVKEV